MNYRLLLLSVGGFVVLLLIAPELNWTLPGPPSSTTSPAADCLGGKDGGRGGGSVGGGGAERELKKADQNVLLYTEEGHDFFAADYLPEDDLAPLTRETQAMLFAHQYRSPEECEKARYLVIEYHNGGLGSQLHVGGMKLGYALATGSIVIWGQHAGHDYVQRAHCPDATGWDCYFKPITNCTPSVYAKDHNTASANQEGMHNPWFVPPQLEERLAKVAPHMKPAEVKYWWRGQSVAFLMRFNKATVAAVAALRRKETMTRIQAPPNGDGNAMAELLRSQLDAGVLFPLPRGTTSMHVRHGDKGIEMELQPFSKYMEASVELLRRQPMSLKRLAFISTEDQAVLDESANNQWGWVMISSDIPRHNSNGVQQMGLADNIVLLHLVQLLMALECDAWVGTLGSNWNRLIDELRCVWVAKCRQPYIEVGEPNSWQDYAF